MTEENVHLALFEEIDPATEAISALRELGVDDAQMTIVSGVPYTHHALDRPSISTRVPLIAIAGFLMGAAASLALTWGTPLQYRLQVGGQPIFPIPPLLVLTFELSMLGLMISTFLGVLWESRFPSFGPKEYHPKISDGRIAVVFSCPPEIHERAHAALADLGAEWMHRTEAQQL